MVYLLFYGLTHGRERLILLGLVGVGCAVLGAFVAVSFMHRRLEQMRQDYAHAQGELEQVRQGIGLSEREHRVLLLRLSGMKLETIATVTTWSKTTVDRVVSDLKSKGVLREDE
jgi:DNA-binding NarL/FixJ family response regulator